MARYSVSIGEKAEADLLALPFPLRRQMNQRILKLAADPRPEGFAAIGTGGGAILYLHGRALLYSVDDDARLVSVVAILPAAP